MDEDDGWVVIDGQTIELKGEACETIKSGDHVLSARFPCEAVVVPSRSRVSAAREAEKKPVAWAPSCISGQKFRGERRHESDAESRSSRQQGFARSLMNRAFDVTSGA